MAGCLIRRMHGRFILSELHQGLDQLPGRGVAKSAHVRQSRDRGNGAKPACPARIHLRRGDQSQEFLQSSAKCFKECVHPVVTSDPGSPSVGACPTCQGYSPQHAAGGYRELAGPSRPAAIQPRVGEIWLSNFLRVVRVIDTHAATRGSNVRAVYRGPERDHDAVKISTEQRVHAELKRLSQPDVLSKELQTLRRAVVLRAVGLCTVLVMRCAHRAAE